MITGALTELDEQLTTKSFALLTTYIEQIKLNPAAVGEWTFFEDEKLVKAIALNKSNYTEGVKEFHKIYTDLHITISGTDTMFAGQEISDTIETYQEPGDYALVHSPTLSTSTVLPGHFVIIPPNELHANELSGENALKVVIKLKP